MAFILIMSIDYFAIFLRYLIFARIILSWLPVGRSGPIVSTIYNLSEPILFPIRSLIQKSPLGGPGMMLDFSPIIAFILIQVVRSILISFLINFL